MDWAVRVGHTEWDVARTVAHLADACLWYAIDLTAGGRELNLVDVHTPQDPEPDALLDTLRTTSTIFLTVLEATPPDHRGFHPYGSADRSGFVAMACDEFSGATAARPYLGGRDAPGGGGSAPRSRSGTAPIRRRRVSSFDHHNRKLAAADGSVPVASGPPIRRYPDTSRPTNRRPRSHTWPAVYAATAAPGARWGRRCR
jgi:hypothetical protein